jgi:type I restriction-modification system DNA methylase subunit
MSKQRTFMDYVEETTSILEQNKKSSSFQSEPKPEPNFISVVTESTKLLSDRFEPKPDMFQEQEVTKRIVSIWNKAGYNTEFDTFLELTLAALERRESDYMAIVTISERKHIHAYAEIFKELYNYFMDGYYGDPLGSLYMQQFSHGHNGEFYTPWNIAYMMAQMLNPTSNETVCDPTCGSGIMLLAVRCVIHTNEGWIKSSQYGRNMYGMDISSRAVMMTKINLYLTDYIYMICRMEQAFRDVIEQPKYHNHDNQDTQDTQDTIQHHKV